MMKKKYGVVVQVSKGKKNVSFLAPKKFSNRESAKTAIRKTKKLMDHNYTGFKIIKTR